MTNYFAPEFGFGAAHDESGFDGAYQHLARLGEWLASDAPLRVEIGHE